METEEKKKEETEGEKENFKYYAFISYNHENKKWAKRLQKNLENYKLPSILWKRDNKVPKRLRPIFRDETDLLPGGIDDRIEEALSESKFLIVVCSPESAKEQLESAKDQKWGVGREIKHFASLNRKKNIIPFIIKGIPNSNDEKTECFHNELKNIQEYLGKDIRKILLGREVLKPKKAYIFIIATILGLDFDTLYRRHKRRKIKHILLWIIAIIVIISSLAFAAYKVYESSAKDIRISLKEQSSINSYLPFPKEGAIMYMTYGDRTDSMRIKSIDQNIIFKNIHGKFIGDTSRIRLNGSDEIFGD